MEKVISPDILPHKKTYCRGFCTFKYTPASYEEAVRIALPNIAEYLAQKGFAEIVRIIKFDGNKIDFESLLVVPDPV